MPVDDDVLVIDVFDHLIIPIIWVHQAFANLHVELGDIEVEIFSDLPPQEADCLEVRDLDGSPHSVCLVDDINLVLAALVVSFHLELPLHIKPVKESDDDLQKSLNSVSIGALIGCFQLVHDLLDQAVPNLDVRLFQVNIDQ
jgi:hypothetical protein